MKRVISVILLFVMLLAMTSCFNTGSVTDTSKDTSSEKDSNITSDTNRPSKPNVVITEDKNVYKAETIDDGAKIKYLKEKLTAPYFTPYYHNYDTALSFTFDDGYDVDTGYIVNEVFAKYGFHGTLMLNGMYFEDTERADAWRDVVSKGYLDVGSHGYAHKNPLEMTEAEFEHEIKYGIEFLKEQFPDQHVLTYATALAQITDEFQAYLDDYVISNRLESGGRFVVLGTDFDPYRIKAFSLDEKHAASYSGTKATVEQATTTHQWTVMLCHCVKEGASGVDIERSRFESFCKWLHENYKDDIWFASFEEVSIYMEQLKHAKINYIDATKESMSFTVSCDLDKDIYNIPMSFTVVVPKFVDSAYAIINGVEYDLEVEAIDAYTKGVTVVDVPIDGQTEVKIMLGGNKNCDNGCFMHTYINSNVVDPTCTTRGYTERICTACGYEYICKYKPAEHTYEAVNYTRTEQRDDGKYIITYRICSMCGEERILKEELSE